MSNHILIYGYGREGKASHEYLKVHHVAEKITVYDAKTHDTTLNWDDYDQIWLSPGVSPDQIPVSEKHKITNQADFFFSNLSDTERKKVIAITGSKGKTTTTTALTHFLKYLGLKAESAGNIGIPLLEALPRLQHGEINYLVAEISSFQAEHIKRSPHTVVFLNLFADHLDRHGNEEDYFKAKQNLWRHQEDGDHLIVPRALLMDLPATFAPKLEAEAYPLSSIFDADHFRENLGTLPAVADALDIKWTKAQLKKALATTPLPAHRLEHIGDAKGCKFYDDAIAVNPTATMAAVNFFKDQLGILILGGKSSGDDPTDLIRLIESVNPEIKVIVTKSELSKEIATVKTTLDITEVKDLPAAVAFAMEYKLKNKVICLSPAAKSYDQYKNFEEKGAHFKELVAQL